MPKKSTRRAAGTATRDRAKRSAKTGISKSSRSEVRTESTRSASRASTAGKSSTKSKSTQPSNRRYPEPPFPKQHQRRPGIEADIEPRPKYEAPAYRGSGKLEGTFRTNIFGYFYMARAALPHLKRGSAIINCGSVTGLQGSGGLLDYSATKGAIHTFTKSLAQNLVEKGIRVNCVAPGPVWTPLNVADKPAEEAAKHGAKVPYKRPAQPEEIAPAFVFFASETDSSYITGEVLTLLGGETLAG